MILRGRSENQNCLKPGPGQGVPALLHAVHVQAGWHGGSTRSLICAACRRGSAGGCHHQGGCTAAAADKAGAVSDEEDLGDPLLFTRENAFCRAGTPMEKALTA